MTTKRDPKKDPRPGDQYSIYSITGDTGRPPEIIKITNRSVMHKYALHKYGIRGGSEYVAYELSNQRGFTFFQSLTGMKKRVKDAEVVNVAE